MYQELKKTLSSSNLNAAEQVHGFIKFQQNELKDQIPVLKRDVTKSSVMFPERYKESSLRKCVDDISLVFLENNHVLNWCDGCRLLVPLTVNNDGNSLMHALSVYMFGVQDKRYVLRQLLYQRLFMEGAKGVLRERWMMKTSSRSTISWNHIVEMASEKKLINLSGIHVFTMSNILGRPIVVLSDQSNENNEEKSMSGIYLPFLRDPSECEKSPIILGYIKGLFVPLISSDSLEIPLCSKISSPDALHSIPMIDYQGNEMNVKFLLPKEEVDNMQIKAAFLDDVRISDSQKGIIPAAMLKFKTPPAHTIELMWSLDQSSQLDENPYTGLLNQNDNAGPLTNENNNTGLPNMETEGNYQSLLPCANNQRGCPNNVSSNNNQNLCTNCYNAFLSKKPDLLCSRKVYGCSNVADNNVHNLCSDCYNFKFIDEANVTNILQNNQTTEYDVLNNLKDNENRLSDAQYDKLNFDTIMKNRPLPALPMNNLIIPAVPKKSQNDTREKIDPSVYSGLAVAADNTGRPDLSNSIRKKVLCATAGCINSIGVDNVHCNHCSNITKNNNIQSLRRQECLMEGCTNTAEVNDSFLCMICFQSQRHVVRENEVFDVRSLAQSLPPVKIPDNISQQQACPNSNIPPIPTIPNIPNLPNVPPPSNIPPQHYERMGATGGNSFQPPRYGGFEAFGLSTKNAALNWQRGGSVSSAAVDTAKCLHCDNHSNPSKDGLCNECFRQREEGQRQVQVGDNTTCECVNDGCKGVGKECFSFLCEECYKKQIDALKTKDPSPQQQQQNQRPNPLPVSYQENVMDPRFIQGGMNQLQQPIMHDGNQMHPNYTIGYSPQNINPLQNMNPPLQQINQIPPGMQFPVNYPFANQPEQVQAFYPVNPPFDPRYQNTGGAPINDPAPTSFPNPVAAGVLNQPALQNCKGLSCEFYGSKEYGGYCSSCFLDITKVEAEKHNEIRTFAPTDGNVVTSPRCKGFQCQNYGSTQRQGYCTQCAQIYLQIN